MLCTCVCIDREDEFVDVGKKILGYLWLVSYIKVHLESYGEGSFGGMTFRFGLSTEDWSVCHPSNFLIFFSMTKLIIFR